jgi:hypothetical protein
MTKTWTCDQCGKSESSGAAMPLGWFTLTSPGEVLVCSAGCMSAVFDDLNAEAAQAAEAWKAGK